MLASMPRGSQSSLNDSGEMLVTRIVRGAALHIGRGEQTLQHAHYAWKVHVGLDAPVWLDSAALVLGNDANARVVVVPPGIEHRVGAVGWSCTLFVAPGTRSTPWRGPARATVYEGGRARRIVDACRAFQPQARADSAELVSEVVHLACEVSGANQTDYRVRRALGHLSCQPGYSLAQLARDVGISLDRLSHVVARDTGMTLRRHAVWSRLLWLLSSNRHYPNIAAAAADAGFSDHAHMTRAYRAMLGRLPSEFKGPPDAVEPWSGQ